MFNSLSPASACVLYTGCILLAYINQPIIAQQTDYSWQSAVDKPTYSNPDSYGYGYCAYWKLRNGATMWTDCDPYIFNRCGVPVSFEYKCCSQFQKVDGSILPKNSNGREKCGRVLPQWDTCPNVVSAIPGYQAFSEHLKFGEMVAESPSNLVTVFAPYTTNQNEINTLYGKFKQSGSSNPILHHVAKGRYYAADLKDRQKLPTLAGSAPLKVTKYHNGITCIDCIELIEADYECKNGLIHLIRKPLYAPNGLSESRNSVLAALQSNSETKAFAADIGQALKEELGNANSADWFTVFAPKSSDWLSIRSKYPDAGDRARIAANHVLRKMYCSAGLVSYMSNVKTADGDEITVDCQTQTQGATSKEVRTIVNSCGERRTITQADLSAVNGVIHLIDGALVPMSVRQIKSALQCSGPMGFDTFYRYIKNCDLRMEKGKKYAVLLPQNYAFNWWKSYMQFSKEYQRFVADEKYRCRVARYHILPFGNQLKGINYMWQQQSGYQSNVIDQRFGVDYFMKDGYKSDMYFHYSRVVNFASRAFAQGSLFGIERINVIPEMYLMDVMSKQSDLSLEYQRAKKIKLGTKVFRPNMPLNLYLATTNKGIVDRDEYKFPDGPFLNFMLLHTVDMYLWGGDIGYFKKNTVHKFMSRIGLELIFWMDGQGTMRIGHSGMPDRNSWPKVIRWNLHAIDGIMWVLDGVLICPKNLCNAIDVDVFTVYAVSCMIAEVDGGDIKKALKKKPYETAIKHKDWCTIWGQPPYHVVKIIKAKPRKLK